MHFPRLPPVLGLRVDPTEPRECEFGARVVLLVPCAHQVFEGDDVTQHDIVLGHGGGEPAADPVISDTKDQRARVDQLAHTCHSVTLAPTPVAPRLHRMPTS